MTSLTNEEPKISSLVSIAQWNKMNPDVGRTSINKNVAMEVQHVCYAALEEQELSRLVV